MKDFCVGIGALTALKLIQKHGSLKEIIANLDSTKYPLPDPFPYETAQGLFKGEGPGSRVSWCSLASFSGGFPFFDRMKKKED